MSTHPGTTVNENGLTAEQQEALDKALAEKFADPPPLTPEQKEKWKATISMMSWRCPGFQHIWYKMLCTRHNRGGAEHYAVLSKGVPIAATDGQDLIINPESYFQLGLQERVFVGAHEILHNIYDDVSFLRRCAASKQVPQMDGSVLPFVNKCLQMAFDYRINALLVESKIGKMPAGDFKGCYDPSITSEDNVLDIYKKVYEDHEQGGGGLSGPGVFDLVLPPGNNAPTRNAQQWAAEIAAAQHAEQRRHGTVSAGIKRLFKAILEPEVPWTEHIRTSISRMLGSGGWNWHKGDRRYITRDIFLPTPSGYGAGWIVCWDDTSGSRSDKERASSLAELSAIISDVRPKRLTLLSGDAEVKTVSELESGEDLKALETDGGGGTDVNPVFEWIDQQEDRPDLFIGFTDGGLEFPKDAPLYPVIWCSSTAMKYPWGEVVRVMKNAG